MVWVARLGPEPFRQQILASEQECAALARRFDLPAISRLSATVELVHRAHGVVLLRAAFEAEFEQSCVVTLEPVPGAVSQEFALLYGPPEAEEGATGGAEDIAFEPLTGDAIDIGEAVAQELSLALPLFPRRPEATPETEEPPGREEGPFAVLSRFSGAGRPK